ncbi:MAG: PaaI family thioesterase [Spirochaetaceae bacterium]|nr:MAG: PaaI family thioesterase [Spirochaetaceae bacterium]
MISSCTGSSSTASTVYGIFYILSQHTRRYRTPQPSPMFAVTDMCAQANTDYTENMNHQGGRRVPNPYAGSENYNCFGCAPHNKTGLRMEFVRHDDGSVTSDWEPRREFEGFPGVVHGGIQAALADETAAWMIHAVLGTAGVTKELHTRYHKPARFEDGPFHIEARETGREGREVEITVTISGRAQGATNALDATSAQGASNPGVTDGTLFTTAVCRFAIFSADYARKRLGFPGAEAFEPGPEAFDPGGEDVDPS